MLRGHAKSFFSGCRAFLGDLPSAEYSREPCIVERYVADRRRWLVKLVHPRFDGKRVFVGDNDVTFYSYYAADAESFPPLPASIRIAYADKCGNALYACQDFEDGALLLEEAPFMVRRFENSTETCWNLHTRVLREQGQQSFPATTFEELSDGGMVEACMPAARELLRAMSEKHGQPEDVIRQLFETPEGRAQMDADVRVVAAVLARWETNGHAIRPLSEGGEQGPSALYRFSSRLLHSCDANCVRVVLQDTAEIRIFAARSIRKGEILSIDYMGGDPEFHALSVQGRREKLLRQRGFFCACSRCERESADRASVDLEGLEVKHVANPAVGGSTCDDWLASLD